MTKTQGKSRNSDFQNVCSHSINIHFQVFHGDAAQNWLILKNGDHTIGLFQDMFERNILTFNPGAEASLGFKAEEVIGRSIGELLSGMRQDLLVRRILLEDRAFPSMERWPGFRRAAVELLKELKQSGLPPAEIGAHLARLAEDFRFR